MMGNWTNGTIGDICPNMDMGRLINFKQDHDVTKKVCIEVAEFSRNLNHKAFLDWPMSIEN